MTYYEPDIYISEIECFIEPVFSSGKKHSTFVESYSKCNACSCQSINYSHSEGRNATWE